MQLSDQQRVQLIGGISQASSYPALNSLIKRCGPPEELEPTVAAYAMLQAANLRGTSSFQEMEEMDTLDAAMEVMDARNQLVDVLVPCLERHISSYPPEIQVTVASAMAQLNVYSESMFSGIAATCCQMGDATGGMAAVAHDALARAAQASPVSVIIEPPSSSSSGAGSRSAGAESLSGGVGDSPGERMEYAALAIQLMMTSSAYALVGHHDQQLFELIAQQTVRFMDSITDMPTLVNILCAFMDVYHIDRPLLSAAGLRLAEHAADLQPADAASVLLVYAFFGVRNPQFYEVLLDVAGRLDIETLDPKTASALYRAIKLMPEPVPIPPAVESLLSQCMDKFGMLALSVTSPAVPSLPMLLNLEEAEDEQTLAIIEDFEMDDIMVRRELYVLLTQAMGLTAVRNYSVTQDGWLPVHVGVQYGGHNIGFLVMKDETTYLRNDSTVLRGQFASELRCIQQEGWIALVMEVGWWQDMLQELEGDEGEEGSMERVAEALEQKMAQAIRMMDGEGQQ